MISMMLTNVILLLGEDLSGELIGVLCAQFEKMLGRKLEVNVSNHLQVN